MAVRADLDVDLRLRGASGELVAAGTAHMRLDVLGMDVGLHVVEDRRGGKARTVPQSRPRSSIASATSASTTNGSNWRPASRFSSAIASLTDIADRYGRSEVIAWKASQAQMTRAPSGISLAASSSG